MAEFVKKGPLGGYKAVPGGTSDPECTHVILEKQEYSRFFQKIHQVERKMRDTADEAAADIQKAHREADRRAQEAVDAAEGILSLKPRTGRRTAGKRLPT